MERQIIELVQVLVDRIEKHGYEQRVREENAFDLNKRLTEAEGWVAHWKQARQEAHEAGELMKAEIETLKDEIKTLKVVSSGLDQTAFYAEQDLEKAQAEIETLRKELAATNRLASTVASERDAAHAAAMAQQHDEIASLRARLDEERSVIAGLRKELANAQRAVSDAFAEVNSVRQQLNAARAAVTLQLAVIERLQAFVEKAQQTISRTMNHCDVEFLLAALAELDAEPAPVAEPLDAEGGA